jgi:hypothetical protein
LVAQKTGDSAEKLIFSLCANKFEDLLELSGSSIPKEIAQAKLLKDL